MFVQFGLIRCTCSVILCYPYYIVGLLPSVLYAEINDTLTLYCVQQVECSEIVFSFNGNDYTASNGYEDFPGFQSNSLPVNVSQDPCNISFTFIRTVAFADESEVSCSGKAGSCRQITTIHSPGEMFLTMFSI